MADEKMYEVRAVAKGFFGGRIILPGEVFTCKASEFSDSKKALDVKGRRGGHRGWMEKIAEVAPAAAPVAAKAAASDTGKKS